MSSGSQGFAEGWIEAFNAHDLDLILSYYADGVELFSPLYRRFTAGRSDRVDGIEALRHYFGTALQLHPGLRFTLLEVGQGSLGPCLRYSTSLDDRIAMECFEMDGAGKARRVLCHYVGS